MDSKAVWTWLTMVLGAANYSFWKMSDAYDSIDDFCRAVHDGTAAGMTEKNIQAAEKIPFSEAERLIDRCTAQGIDVVPFDSEDYPERLKWTPNPPPVLFMRGNADALSASAVIAVIGTRRPCEYSMKVTERICGQLAKAGVTVISGFESGIDIESNRAAIAGGGVTGAVCGRGICDSRLNGEMSEAVAHNGVLLSEITDSNDFNYVRFDCRNRILCGLADGVLFIECSSESQGLNNAAHARILGRPIFAVPPADIADRRFYGQRNLLRSGAVPVFDANDILINLHSAGKAQDLLLLEFEEETGKVVSQKTGKNKIPTENLKKIQKNSSEGLHKSENSVTIDMSGLTQRQQEICKLLAGDTVHLNILSERMETPVNLLVNDLMLMQMKNIVEELPGRLYKLRNNK
jgi:DNA processing protein